MVKGGNTMIGRYKSRFAIIAGLITLTLPLILAVSPAHAQRRDRTPPTTPTNLRVTSTTSYSVSLAWNPSTDNSGSFSYRIRHSWGYEATVPQSQTTFTWTTNLEPRQTYSFFVYAVDAAGNRSRNSNTVTVTLSVDRTPPTKPVVTVKDIGPTYVTLSWSSVDDGPYVWYTVYKDGSPVIQGTSATSGTIHLLEPETAYTFTVKARDFGINWSPLSDPLTVTTKPTNPNDTTPPTTPTNLRTNGMVFQDGETWLFWDQSTDNLDPQSVIRYDVYLNGVLADIAVGSGRSIIYATVGIVNTIEVVAIDTAGNQSPPATILIDLRGL
jgi:chitodextrinase